MLSEIMLNEINEAKWNFLKNILDLLVVNDNCVNVGVGRCLSHWPLSFTSKIGQNDEITINFWMEYEKLCVLLW